MLTILLKNKKRKNNFKRPQFGFWKRGILFMNLSPIYKYGEKQEIYCQKIKEYYKNILKIKSPKAFVKTYGCQQNVSDSEKYKGMLVHMGFSLTENQENADVILFNTCAIRENAENKAFGNIGWVKNLKKTNENLFIILCGCMTEQKTIINKIKLKFSFIDLVFGTHSIHKFPKYFYEALLSKKASGKTSAKTYIKETEDIIAEDFPEVKNNNLKAFLPIMYGCNNFCSYCIVPYVRGRERSRNSKEIISEFKKLLKSGYKDITLLGQNVNSYGKGLEEDINFSKLLKKLDSFEGEYTIRFMTSHPKDATNELFDVISESKHIAHHIHLPVQCGSNKILEKMNRKYTKESYLKIIDYAKSKIPDIIFSSDIIVGFPGETYEDFLETIDILKKVKFHSLFTFIYSPREGTPAANLPDPVTKHEKTAWLLELLKVQEEISEELHKKMLGKTFRALAESFSPETNELLCRTSGNIIVEVTGEKEKVGNFLNVLITGYKKDSLKGKII